MKDEELNWILSLPEKAKLDFIDQSLKDGDAVMAIKIATIFLDAPISKGGIATAEIDKVFKKNK